MNEQDWIEKRAHPRLSWRFVIKFKHKGENAASWELPTMKDVSEGGCFFYCNTPCIVSDLLDIEIQFPLIKEPMKFVGEVRRVESFENNLIAKFGVGIQFVEMEEEKKEKFAETINLLLGKQEKE